MSNPRRNMQPVPGTLRDGRDGGAVAVMVALYGDRIVVRGETDIAGVPLKRLRRDAAIPARQAGTRDGFDTSHPSDAARAKRFAAAAKSGTEPTLSAADWQALQAICKA